MDLINFYRRESTISALPVILMTLLSGISNAVLISIINNAVATAAYKNLNLQYFILFIIIFTTTVITRKYSLSRSMMIAEGCIRSIRVRITDKVRRSELGYIEKIGKSTIFTRLTYDTQKIAEASILIINACQATIMLVCCLFYIATLSMVAFFICILCLSISVILYRSRRKYIVTELHASTEKETEFFGLLDDIIDGFKEIRVNRKKSDHIFAFFKKLALDNERLRITTGLRFVTQAVMGRSSFYVMLGFIVFILPAIGEDYSELISRIVAAVMFLTGPIEETLAAMPAYARGTVAIANIYGLEKHIDSLSNNKEGRVKFSEKEIPSFEEIVFDNVIYHYTDKKGKPLFTLGPINLSIKKGETIFIVGGNGSGKTSFMKILTGLYFPTSGTIRIDGLPLNENMSAYEPYRNFFSNIFSDFHLFNRLYGIPKPDKEKTDELLRLMMLDKKTSVVNGKFTTIDLSTGQKKRLAMIVTMLEDKQICVFDEWAADQDPSFREYYYRVLLKDMKKKGKTIIAVSHDDRYFNVADRTFKMDFGKLREINLES